MLFLPYLLDPQMGLVLLSTATLLFLERSYLPGRKLGTALLKGLLVIYPPSLASLQRVAADAEASKATGKAVGNAGAQGAAHRRKKSSRKKADSQPAASDTATFDIRSVELGGSSSAHEAFPGDPVYADYLLAVFALAVLLLAFCLSGLLECAIPWYYERTGLLSNACRLMLVWLLALQAKYATVGGLLDSESGKLFLSACIVGFAAAFATLNFGGKWVDVSFREPFAAWLAEMQNTIPALSTAHVPVQFLYALCSTAAGLIMGGALFATRTFARLAKASDAGGGPLWWFHVCKALGKVELVVAGFAMAMWVPPMARSGMFQVLDARQFELTRLVLTVVALLPRVLLFRSIMRTQLELGYKYAVHCSTDVTRGTEDKLQRMYWFLEYTVHKSPVVMVEYVAPLCISVLCVLLVFDSRKLETGYCDDFYLGRSTIYKPLPQPVSTTHSEAAQLLSLWTFVAWQAGHLFHLVYNKFIAPDAMLME